MKEIYEQPILLVASLEQYDVVTLSSGNDPDNGDDYW